MNMTLSSRLLGELDVKARGEVKNGVIANGRGLYLGRGVEVKVNGKERRRRIDVG